MLMFHISSLLTFLAVPAFGVIFQKGREQGYDNGVQETTSSGFQSQCIDIHNQFRRMHGAPALSYSPQLAAYARQRAHELARKDGTNFYHPDGLPYGENLAWNSQSSVDCGLPLKLWYDEWKIYNFNRPNISPSNGHFTQMVWKQSRSIGCAQVRSNGKNGGVYTVCNYDPPGNYENEERQNVQPAMGTSGGYDVTPDIQSYRRKKIRRTYVRTGNQPWTQVSTQVANDGGNWLTVQMPPNEYPSSGVSTPISSIFGSTNSYGSSPAFSSSSFGSSGFGSGGFGSSWNSGSNFQRIGSSSGFGNGIRSTYNRNPFSSSFGGFSTTTASPSFSYGGFGGFGGSSYGSSFGGSSFGSGFGGFGSNSWSWKKK